MDMELGDNISKCCNIDFGYRMSPSLSDNLGSLIEASLMRTVPLCEQLPLRSNFGCSPTIEKLIRWHPAAAVFFHLSTMASLEAGGMKALGFSMGIEGFESTCVKQADEADDDADENPMLFWVKM